MAEQSNPGRMHYIDEIDQQLGRMVSWVEIANKCNRTDLSVISENILCSLLNLVYGWKLTNVNSADKPNFPGVDLKDDTLCIAVQVTATVDLQKVKKTLENFYKYNLDEHYSRLILMTITNEEPTQGMRDKKEGCFYGKRDIWNIPRLAREIQNKDIETLKAIATLLEQEVGTLYSKSEEQPETRDTPEEPVQQQNHEEPREEQDAPEETGFLNGLWEKIRNTAVSLFEEDDNAEPVSFGTISLVVLGFFLAIGLLGWIFEGSTPLDTMPEELSEYSLHINGQTIQVPTTFEQMRSYGWYCADSEKMKERIPPHAFGESYLPSMAELTNGHGVLSVYYGNASNHTLEAEDCIIYGISVECSDFDNSYTGESMNTCKGPMDLTLGKSKWIDQVWPYGKNKEKDALWITCSYVVDDKHFYEFVFRKDIKTLEKIKVVNRDQEAMDALIHTVYETQEPDYNPNEFAKWLGVKLSFETGNFKLPIGVMTRDYQELGYIQDKAPKFVSSGEHEEIFFRFDALNKLSGEAFNPFDQALVSEYCFIGCMDSADIESSDEEFSLHCAIGEQFFSVSKGMPAEDLYQILEDMNIKWENSGENSITFYPNGNNKKITVTCIFSKEFQFVSRVQVDTCQALREFFVDVTSKG